MACGDGDYNWRFLQLQLWWTNPCTNVPSAAARRSSKKRRNRCCPRYAITNRQRRNRLRWTIKSRKLPRRRLCRVSVGGLRSVRLPSVGSCEQNLNRLLSSGSAASLELNTEASNNGDSPAGNPESDVEIISNPSQSSIEVLEVHGR